MQRLLVRRYVYTCQAFACPYEHQKGKYLPQSQRRVTHLGHTRGHASVSDTGSVSQTELESLRKYLCIVSNCKSIDVRIGSHVNDSAFQLNVLRCCCWWYCGWGALGDPSIPALRSFPFGVDELTSNYLKRAYSSSIVPPPPKLPFLR